MANARIYNYNMKCSSYMGGNLTLYAPWSHKVIAVPPPPPAHYVLHIKKSIDQNIQDDHYVIYTIPQTYQINQLQVH